MTKRDYDETRYHAARMLKAMHGVTHFTRRAAYDAAIEHLAKEGLALLRDARHFRTQGLPEIAQHSRARADAHFRAATLLTHKANRLS